jgi:phosphoglycerate dehydrogenase-like enzyme
VPVVVMFFPESRLQAAKVAPPNNWDLRFLESPSRDEVIAACREADCILTLGSAAGIDARVLENSPKLKLVQCLGAGFNHVDLTAADRLEIPVANSPGQNAGTVAEFTIGAIIALQRRIVEADTRIKAGNYALFRKELLDLGLNEIGGSRIGLVGLGNIGQQVAKIAVMLGAGVHYFSLHRKSRDLELQLGIEYSAFDSLLSGSDIVSLHVPLNAETSGLIAARELALMPSGSLLVNTSRGEVVDQAALAAALESGHLAGAAVDTLSPEPPGADHPLLNLSRSAADRLLLTPHIAGVTVSSFRRMLGASIANIERVLRGEPPEHPVGRIR